MSSKLYIAYCEENKSVANDIVQKLGKANFTFIPLSSLETKNNEGLTFLIAETKVPGILLLSDNLLKDEVCMQNMFNFLQNSSVAESMRIVVVDGQYTNGNVETSFSRVSNVIRYMNFWQEKYLEMRKQKRSIEPAHEEMFNAKLQSVKEISSEIGDFLRLVRNKDFWTYDQLVFNNFELFFKKHGNATLHQNYIKSVGASKSSITTPSTTASTNTAPKSTPTPSSINSRVSNPTSTPALNEVLAQKVNAKVSPKTDSLKLAAESIEEISAKIPANSSNIPPVNTPIEKPSINDLFQKNTPSKTNINKVTETIASKVKTTTPLTIAEKAMLKEEEEVNEVLKQVDYLETENIVEHIESPELPNIDNRSDLNSESIKENSSTKTLNEVFQEEIVAEVIPPVINEPVIESTIEDTIGAIIPNTPVVPIEENISEEAIDEIIPENIDITPEILEEEPPTNDDFDPMEGIEVEDITDELEEEEEEDFDPMEGIDVEDITDELEEEEEEDFDPMEGIEVEDITDELEEEDDEEEEQQALVQEIYEADVLEGAKTDEEVEDQAIFISSALGAAGALMMDGDHQKGSKTFEALIEKHPKNVEVRYQYAHTLKEEANDLDKAAIQFEQIIKLDPNHYPSYKALAEISEQNNDFLLAKSYYEKVINLHPEETGVYYKLGLITAGFYAEKPKQAAKYFKKAIKQDSKNEDAYYQLGLIQNEQQGKPKKALENYLKTLKLNPNHKFVNYDLALLYHKLGDKMNAALYYSKAWSINSELKTPENDLAFNLKNQEDLNTQTLSKTPPAPVYDNDKIVLITGGTSGIGRATARKFAEHGFKIIITGRREDRLEALKTEFKETYDNDIKTLNFDVRNIAEVKSMIENLDEEWRNIDVLINNAGLAKGFAPIHEGDIEDWNTMIDTNIKGLLFLTRAVAPHMVKRKSGHIINVCSTAGKEVYPNGNVYCATKHAVDSLTRAMRLDLYKHNIRVGQVSPAHVEETEFAFVRFEDQEKAKIYNDFQPLKSSDVADALFYIVNTPNYVNVQDIVLMGKQQANSNNIDRSGREENKTSL